MLLTNLTTRDVFLPTGSKVGILVPGSGSLTVDDSLRQDSAVVSALTAGLLSAGSYSTAAESTVVQEELGVATSDITTLQAQAPSKMVPLVLASGPTLVPHGLGYHPLVQLLDAAGTLVPWAPAPPFSLLHPDMLTFVVDVGVGPFTGTVVYQ